MQEIRWHELADGSKSCKYPGPFHGAEGIPRPLAHLCHIPFLAPQPSLRRALPMYQCRLHRWRDASQPWVSAVRQARAWQRGGGGPGAVVLSDCRQGRERLRSIAKVGESLLGHPLLGVCLPSPSITWAISRSIFEVTAKPTGCAQQGAVRAQGDLRSQTGLALQD